MYFTPLLPIAETVTETLFAKGAPQCGAESVLFGLAAMTADFLAEHREQRLDYDHVTAILEFDDYITTYAPESYPRKSILQQALWLCVDHVGHDWSTVKKDILSRLRGMEA